MSTNNNDKIKNLLNSASKQLKTNPKNLKQAAQNKDFSEIFKNMEPNQAKKLQNILSDKEATAKILSTPQAKNLLKILLEDEKNG